LTFGVYIVYLYHMRALKITQSITTKETESFNKYLRDVSGLDMINSQTEIELAKQIKAGDIKAQDELVKANLRFVISVAKQYVGRGLDIEDLVSEGNLGLIKAAQKFDETRGIKFISFAVWWIRQSILQSLADNSRQVRLPLNQINALNKIKSAENDLEQQLQRKATASELSEYLGVTEDKVNLSITSSQKISSMDTPIGDDSDFTLADTFQSSDFADTEIIQSDILQKINTALNSLTERERFIIINLFGIGVNEMTLVEISNKLDLTSERVRQIKNTAIKKLSKSGVLSSLV
jgi:RNA polymerase primary sigma factor